MYIISSLYTNSAFEFLKKLLANEEVTPACCSDY